MSNRVRVIKVGGSLLGRPDADRAVRGWIRRVGQSDPAEHIVLIVGGGEPVEELRRLDRRQPLGEARAHWQAIELMDANTRLVANWLPEALLTDAWPAIAADAAGGGVTLFQTGVFLRDLEPRLPGRKLPIGWRVTSDSIAARVAVVLGAGLTLLKSRPFEPPRSHGDWVRLAEAGAVDASFPEIVGELPDARLATLD